MAEVIRMPKMSDTMEEGVIAAWLKKVGDEVKSGDILAEVETDKATMEYESTNEVAVYGFVFIVDKQHQNKRDDSQNHRQGKRTITRHNNCYVYH